MQPTYTSHLHLYTDHVQIGWSQKTLPSRGAIRLAVSRTAASGPWSSQAAFRRDEMLLQGWGAGVGVGTGLLPPLAAERGAGEEVGGPVVDVEGGPVVAALAGRAVAQVAADAGVVDAVVAGFGGEPGA